MNGDDSRVREQFLHLHCVHDTRRLSSGVVAHHDPFTVAEHFAAMRVPVQMPHEVDSSVQHSRRRVRALRLRCSTLQLHIGDDNIHMPRSEKTESGSAALLCRSTLSLAK